MEVIVVNLSYKIRHSKAMRVICWPFINIIRYFRKKTFGYTKYGKFIATLKNTHLGERCFIIGNGPSLIVDDLEKLKGEFTFGMNRIYQIFDQTDWRPDCYAAVDIYILKKDNYIIRSLELPLKIVDTLGKKYMSNDNSIHYINVCDRFTIKKYTQNTLKKIKFSNDLHSYCNQGHTVTFICIQLAVYMGFKQIYLLGMDHTFAQSVDTNGKFTLNKDTKNHFYKGFDGINVCQFTNGVDYSYNLARHYCENNNIQILNATRGGKLEIFERANLDELIQ
jgi:hypothetical protein